MAGLPVIGRELIRLGFASDAIPNFQEALALADQPGSPTNVVIAAAENFNPSAIRNDLDNALNGLPRPAGRGGYPVDCERTVGRPAGTEK